MRLRRREDDGGMSGLHELPGPNLPVRKYAKRYASPIAFFTAAVVLLWLLLRMPRYANKLKGSSHITSPVELSELRPSGEQSTRRPNPSVQHSHREVFCRRTSTGRFFRIDFVHHDAFNANVIPHPTLPQHWFIVAQKYKEEGDQKTNQLMYAELICAATFVGDTLRCMDAPITLSIAATLSPKCTADIEWWNLSIGPRDARVFMGPHGPLAIYGSQSAHSCMGLFMQDFRMISDWPTYTRDPKSPFDSPYDLVRPHPISVVQKNYFAFWDMADQMYMHHDIYPHRSFSKFTPGDNAPRELAAQTSQQDEACLARYLPRLPAWDIWHPLEVQSIHQGTNALSVTMCKHRKDKTCVPTAANTYIVTIIHHKSVIAVKAWYEPYVVMFRARPPFELYSVSSKPLWIHGRTHVDVPDRERNTSPNQTPPGQPESFYMTSINWADKGHTHLGYLDDDIFLAFGIEDIGAGGIQILAADLLADMGLCDQPGL